MAFSTIHKKSYCLIGHLSVNLSADFVNDIQKLALGSVEYVHEHLQQRVKHCKNILNDTTFFAIIIYFELLHLVHDLCQRLLTVLNNKVCSKDPVSIFHLFASHDLVDHTLRKELLDVLQDHFS